MNKSGFITLHRQILNWEWSKNANTFVLFIHLLLAANFEEGRFEGRVIKRGQLVTSLPSLSTGTGLSIQQVRTALSHLVSTGEITDSVTNRYRIITIVKYSEFQDATGKSTGKQQTDNRQLTDNQQTTNRQITDNQQQYNNNNKNNKETKEQGNKGTSVVSASHFTPPTADQVREYCQEQGIEIDPEYFVDYYEARGWVLSTGTKMKNWKATVRNWGRREKERPAKVITENPFLRMLREREEAKEE